MGVVGGGGRYCQQRGLRWDGLEKQKSPEPNTYVYVDATMAQLPTYR
jgi:hypothetical protein